MKPVHSSRLECWLGRDQVESLSRNFTTWYGPPVKLIDVPGNVWVTGGGDFVGSFSRGSFGSMFDAFADYLKRLDRAIITPRPAFLGAGFASISDALSRASQGYSQALNGNIQKVGATGLAASAFSLWRLGNTPAAGSASSAAPGGRAPTSATTGALAFTNAAGSDTLHLVGADMGASVAANALLLYDRIFDVVKTMNSTSAESVTGVPTRYQSTTSTAMDYAGGNFVFPEVGGTALAATAHNWTVNYTDQGGTTAQTSATVAGNSGAIVDRIDLPTSTWFMPLATDDTGIQKLESMTCSALVATGAVNFVMGHPIGVMAFPLASLIYPFDWLTNRNPAPRIFNDACLALMELPKPSSGVCSYFGQIYATSAAP